MKELHWQRHLIEDVEKLGGYGLKMSNQFTSGVPDLLLQIPDMPTCAIECKVKKVASYSIGKQYSNQMTKLQRITIKEMQDAGMVAGGLVLFDDGSTTHYMCVVSDCDAGMITMGKSDLIRRKRGEVWQTKKIVQMLTLKLQKEKDSGT